MSSTRSTNRSTAISSALTAENSEAIRHLAGAASQADAVVLGAGSGLSAAAGLSYSGPASRASSRDHFVITTNIDHAFARNGFDESFLFATQGDYGLWQCSVPCHAGTWSNESAVREMVERQRDLRIPSSLLPVCPRCGEPAAMNLRVDGTFVEDGHWHDAAERYRRFLSEHESDRILYLEIGVGWNTPSLIKFPFWQRTYANTSATFATLNQEPEVPQQIEQRSITVPGDIASSIKAWKALTQR